MIMNKRFTLGDYTPEKQEIWFDETFVMVDLESAPKLCKLLNELNDKKTIATECIIFADELIEDLGSEEMKKRWRRGKKRRIE